MHSLLLIAILFGLPVLRRACGIVALLLLALATSTVHAEPRHPSVPVLIQQYPYDAVVTVDPRGDGFLAVK
jgi:hypothetical protein